MKKCVLIITALWMVWTAGIASASSLVYQPESISLTIPAGAEQQSTVKIGIENGKASTYYLFLFDNLSNGTLPASWLSMSPASTFLFGASSASALLKIRVPEGTSSGVYSAYLRSRAMASHDTALAGNGIRIDVTVPSQCSGIPVVSLDSVLPTVIWPPDHCMTQVLVNGTVQMPEGCTLAEAGYAIDDEYGVLSGVGTIQVTSSGSFSAALPVEAMRHGQDKDGRLYSITVYAKNQSGTGSSLTQTVVVPHDRSKK